MEHLLRQNIVNFNYQKRIWPCLLFRRIISGIIIIWHRNIDEICLLEERIGHEGDTECCNREIRNMSSLSSVAGDKCQYARDILQVNEMSPDYFLLYVYLFTI
jgi:hypothetical protein